jgi:undecaprenyl-diphosphatase
MGLMDSFWAICLHVDNWVTRQIERLWPKWTFVNVVMVVVAKYTPIAMLGLFVTAAADVIGGTSDERMTFLRAGSAIVAAVVIRLIHEPISRLLARPRPFDTEPFQPLLAHDPGDSFPSNHAGGAMALACGASGLSGYHTILLVMAICLCISRVYCGLHYMSDVVVGAAGGICVGLICANLAASLAWW